jgi:hypothetical protein
VGETNRQSKHTKGRRRERTDEVSPESAYQQARDILSLPDNPTTKANIEKRHEMYPTLDQKMGDRVNAVAALRLSGFWDKEIQDLLDIPKDACSRLDQRHPQEMALAEAHALKMADHKMRVNRFRVRAAASRLAPKMLDVLQELAEDKAVKDHIRRQSAMDLLSLIGLGDPGPQKNQDNVKRGALVAIQNIIDKQKEEPTIVVEGEVVEAEDE